jgi:hypothetical protein
LSFVIIQFQLPVVRNIIEMIRKVDPVRYGTEQYIKELKTLEGAGVDAEGSVLTGIRMLQVAGGLI